MLERNEEKELIKFLKDKNIEVILKYYDNRNYKTDLPDRSLTNHDFIKFAEQVRDNLEKRKIYPQRLLPNGATVVVYFVINRDGYLRNVKIEKGNKATDWSPSLEDEVAWRKIVGLNYVVTGDPIEY